jgi:hypothetical protein
MICVIFQEKFSEDARVPKSLAERSFLRLFYEICEDELQW